MERGSRPTSNPPPACRPSSPPPPVPLPPSTPPRSDIKPLLYDAALYSDFKQLPRATQDSLFFPFLSFLLFFFFLLPFSFSFFFFPSFFLTERSRRGPEWNPSRSADGRGREGGGGRHGARSSVRGPPWRRGRLACGLNERDDKFEIGGARLCERMGFRGEGGGWKEGTAREGRDIKYSSTWHARSESTRD